MKKNRKLIYFLLFVFNSFHWTVGAQTVSNSFLNFPNGTLNLSPGQQIKLNKAILRFTAKADLQVVDISGAVLWNTKTSSNCSSQTQCLASFSGGNLFVKGDKGNILFSTKTASMSGRSMVFSNQSDFITIFDNTYTAVWSSGLQPAKGYLSFLRSEKVATSVQSFIDSLGINTHMSQYEGNAQIVLDKLNYLGVKHIRDSFSATNSLLNSYQLLASHQIKFNIVFGGVWGPKHIQNAETLDGLSPASLESLEGPNEINNFPFSCNNSVWEHGWPNNNGPAAQCFMQNLFAEIGLAKKSAKLSNVKIFDLTGGRSAYNAEQFGLLDLAGRADFGNVHVYPNGGQQPGDRFLSAIANSYYSVAPSQAVVTESGYTTSLPKSVAQVSEAAQAILNTNIYLESYRAGFFRTFIYELTDNVYEGYGVFKSSTKAVQPKKAATAIHNLTTILNDQMPPIATPKSLSYTIKGMPKTGKVILLQKANGAFCLVIWNDIPVFSKGQDILAPSIPLKLVLRRKFSKISYFDPMVDSIAQRTMNNANSFDFLLGNNAVIIELEK